MSAPLLIRADAGPEIGAGHVMRCLALAQGWQDRGGRALLATAMRHPAIAARLRQEGVEVHLLEAAPGSAGDAQRTAELAREAGTAWVVVDGYRLSAPYRHRLREAGLRVLWVDDPGCPGSCGADLVLNQNLHAAEDLYPGREASTRLLLGRRYLLLRREFRSWRRRRREIPPVAGRVLVTAGGADPCRLTVRAVAALHRLGLRATVVTGPLESEDPALLAAAGGSDRILFRRHVEDMPELMAAADLAVSAAGGTAWELAFMGVPMLLVITADNQIPVAGCLAARGAAVNLGHHGEVTARRLEEELRRLAGNPKLRRALAEEGRRVVDGEGVERVVSCLLGERPPDP